MDSPLRDMVEKFLVVNEIQAKRLFDCTDEEIESAKLSKDGLIKRAKMDYVNDGTVPLYLQKK